MDDTDQVDFYSGTLLVLHGAIETRIHVESAYIHDHGHAHLHMVFLTLRVGKTWPPLHLINT